MKTRMNSSYCIFEQSHASSPPLPVTVNALPTVLPTPRSTRTSILTSCNIWTPMPSNAAATDAKSTESTFICSSVT